MSTGRGERKILYSPSYGAGWVSWHSGPAEQLKFMLEHPALIAAVEAQRALTDEQGEPNLDEPALQTFIREWRAAWPDSELPYMGGLRDIRVQVVPADTLVHIDDRDGFESVDTQWFDPDEWL